MSVKGVVAIVLAVVVALVIYGTAVEPRLILDVGVEPGPVPGLPAEWEGQKVAVIADLQVGMWWANEGMARRAVERIVEERPALALIPGDFLYHPGETPAEQVAEAVEIVRPLAEAGIPTYAVLGNHDWGLKTPEDAPNPEAVRLLREALPAAGIPLLHNHAVPLRADGGDPLYLVGIGSRYADEDEPAAALQEVPDDAPRMVFMHNPDSFEEIPAGAAPLAVAAHTHGGQIRVPGLPDWSWLALTQGGRVTTDGWIEDYGAPGNRLYVNRGIGFSLVPMRLFCPPEVTIFVLERAVAPSPGGLAAPGATPPAGRPPP